MQSEPYHADCAGIRNILLRHGIVSTVVEENSRILQHSDEDAVQPHLRPKAPVARLY
jgi:hypothetical protein